MPLLPVYVCLGPLGGLFPILSYSAKFSIKGLPKPKEMLPFVLTLQQLVPI